VNSVISFIVVTVIAIYLFIYLLLSFYVCVICTGLAESNAARFDFMEHVIVIECVVVGLKAESVGILCS
jgi:hypothetical protein